MKILLTCLIFCSGLQTWSQSFNEDWKKVSKVTFENENSHLRLSYVLKNKISGAVLEKYQADYIKSGAKSYTNAFGVESLQSGSYSIIVDNESKVISVFPSNADAQVRATSKSGNFEKELEKFAVQHKPVVIEPEGQNKELKVYQISLKEGSMEKIIIRFNMKTYVLHSVTYFYKPFYNGMVKEDFRLDISFSMPPFTSFKHSVSNYVDVRNKKVTAQPRYSTYKIISHL